MTPKYTYAVVGLVSLAIHGVLVFDLVLGGICDGEGVALIYVEFHAPGSAHCTRLSRSLWSPGGVLGPKNDGGVPLAAENWTQKDRGKN